MGASNSQSQQNQNYDYQAGQQQYQQQQQQQRISAQQRQQMQQQQYQQQQQAIMQQNQAQVQAQLQQMQQYQRMQMAQLQQMNQNNQASQMQAQNAQQYNQMYRSWRQSMHQRGGAQGPQPNEDLKNFYIKVALNKESIKARIEDQDKLIVTFKYDTLCNSHIRVNMCVTEKKNPNNAPEMFYTPNRDNYIQNVSVTTGTDQEIQPGQIKFDINYLAAFELTKSIKDYYPMIISVNYTDEGQQYAMMTYCTFTKDGQQNINGVHVIKQVVLINGLPFELKSIYGMTQEEGAEEGQQAIEDDNPDAECLICLSEPKDTLIMPCCHFCVCEECGKQLVKAKQTCPICRGNISSLIPMKKNG